MTRRRHDRRKNSGGGAPKWMVTYSDMVTLILVFFVLLFSMSQIDQERFEALAQSFQDRVIFDFLPSIVPGDHPSSGNSADTAGQGDGEEGEDRMEPPEDPMEEIGDEADDEPQLEERLENLYSEISSYIKENDLDNLVTASKTEYGVSLVLQEKILFQSGEATILDDGFELLDEVAFLLSEVPNHVRVEGHTDSRPISNFRYPSNWELSGARASSVVRYFIDEKGLEGERFSAVGYGDTQPVVENTPETWKENRRVEIVILDSNLENGQMNAEN